MSKSTTKIRIPVAVEPDGSVLHGIGGSHGEDEDKLSWLESRLQKIAISRAKTVWIEAEVPVPEADEVEGEVV